MAGLAVVSGYSVDIDHAARRTFAEYRELLAYATEWDAEADAARWRS